MKNYCVYIIMKVYLNENDMLQSEYYILLGNMEQAQEYCRAHEDSNNEIHYSVVCRKFYNKYRLKEFEKAGLLINERGITL